MLNRNSDNKHEQFKISNNRTNRLIVTHSIFTNQSRYILIYKTVHEIDPLIGACNMLPF